MKFLVLLAVVAFGYWQHSTSNTAKSAFDAAGNPVVHFFTFPDCGKLCSDAESQLKRRRVPYVRFEVDQRNPDDSATKRWKEVKGEFVPLIVVGNERTIATAEMEVVRVLGRYFDDAYLLPSERRYFSKHFDDQGKPKIVLYGADWCPSCKSVKAQLNNNGTPFLEIDMDRSGEKKAIAETLSIPGYPSVFVGYERMRHGNDVGAMTSVWKKGQKPT
jgi:glutaredoxin